VIYQAYFRGPSFPTSCAWVREPRLNVLLPTDDGVTLLVCVVPRAEVDAFKSDIEGNFLRSWTDLPDGPDMARAERISKVAGFVDFPNLARPPAWRGMALIGDAAQSVDPVAAAGCGWAFTSAEWLVDNTADALVSGGDLQRGLELYEVRHAAELRLHFEQICEASSGRPTAMNKLGDLVSEAALFDPSLAALRRRFTHRLIGVSEYLSPTTLERAVSVLRTHGEHPSPARESR
ncbi:MAG: NAD(P)/FAD-dependent oxidoreductase, partial [Myxococcota bacterium]